MSFPNETIVARATPAGQGGVGIVRVSGPRAGDIARTLLKKRLTPRNATLCSYYDEGGCVIDQGIALFFAAPNSFTGEDVLELHGHGGSVVIDVLLRRIQSLGVRLAHPGEFSERAFLNDKLDLTQAEAVADLIAATSEEAARCAVRSLQGEFSRRVSVLVEQVIRLRTYIEAAIDFPEEEIDFLSESQVGRDLEEVALALQSTRDQAKQGSLIHDGISVVIAGKPNVGKSSLLNCLSGQSSAIVTDVPGTTRDVLREHIHIDGLPIHVIDTAGLRESNDVVEGEGVRRALKEIERADHVLLMVDAREKSDGWLQDDRLLSQTDCFKRGCVTVLRNKIDLAEEQAGATKEGAQHILSISAKTREGIDVLRNHIKHVAGFRPSSEGNFIARRRHLDALDCARQHLLSAQTQLMGKRAELLAEDLRQAQNALGEITGAFYTDALLGRIFSTFCVGK